MRRGSELGLPQSLGREGAGSDLASLGRRDTGQYVLEVALRIDSCFPAGEHLRVEAAPNLSSSLTRKHQPVVPSDRQVPQISLGVVIVNGQTRVGEKHLQRVTLAIQVAQSLAKLALGQRRVLHGETIRHRVDLLDEASGALDSYPRAKCHSSGYQVHP